MKIASRFQTFPSYTPIEPFEVLSARLGIPADQIVKLDANENPYQNVFIKPAPFTSGDQWYQIQFFIFFKFPMNLTQFLHANQINNSI